MTKKDYIAIAKAIRDSHKEPIVAGRETTGISIVTTKLADMLASDNPNFNREKFLRACLVE